MIENFARLGYASKALIYAIVGCMAAAAALNRGGGITATRRALRVLLAQPFGNALLFIVASGSPDMRRGVCSMRYDPARHGTSAGGVVVRAGSLPRSRLGNARSRSAPAGTRPSRIEQRPFGPADAIVGRALSASP